MNEREGGGLGLFHSEWWGPSLRDPRGRQRREGGGARGGHGRRGAKLLERADMSGVSSNFVKKYVRGS
jgi:hypothetical protein